MNIQETIKNLRHESTDYNRELRSGYISDDTYDDIYLQKRNNRVYRTSDSHRNYQSRLSPEKRYTSGHNSDNEDSHFPQRSRSYNRSETRNNDNDFVQSRRSRRLSDSYDDVKSRISPERRQASVRCRSRSPVKKKPYIPNLFRKEDKKLLYWVRPGLESPTKATGRSNLSARERSSSYDSVKNEKKKKNELKLSSEVQNKDKRKDKTRKSKSSLKTTITSESSSIKKLNTASSKSNKKRSKIANEGSSDSENSDINNDHADETSDSSSVDGNLQTQI